MYFQMYLGDVSRQIHLCKKDSLEPSEDVHLVKFADIDEIELASISQKPA